MSTENPTEPKNMVFHNLPSLLHLDVVLQDLHTLRDIQVAQNHYLKLVETKVDQHVTFTWEPPIPLPIKLPLGLFNLLPYMLRKFDRENSHWMISRPSLVSYQACLKRWEEWIDNVFMASFGLWTHKDHISHTCQVIYDIIGLCHIYNKPMVRFLCIHRLMTHML
jgi:hypothetical protein